MSDNFDKTQEGDYGCISIKDAVRGIDKNEYILPSLQRKFIWKPKQIENLFNSIMMGFPINFFIFWKVRSKTANDYVFYEFLKKHSANSSDNYSYYEQHKINSVSEERTVVVDGQQRLNSLYLALWGTCKFKTQNKQEIHEKKLYLIMTGKENEKTDHDYEFKFFSNNEQKEYKKRYKKEHEGKECLLLKIHEILTEYDQIGKEEKLEQYLEENQIPNDKINDVRNTLNRFFDFICEKKLIHYYEEKSHNLDKVLKMFISTNSGGISLSSSDLIFSIISSKWSSKHKNNGDFNAREKIDDLIQDVSRKFNFEIPPKFILKTYLVLFKDNIRFIQEHFIPQDLDQFKNEWVKIRQSIIWTFELLSKHLNFDNKKFVALNAAIPIIYQIYYSYEQYEKILKHSVHLKLKEENEKNIFKWLNLTFIKKIFSNSSDLILQKIRKVLLNKKNENPSLFPFPLKEIAEEFNKDTSKNYKLEDKMLTDLIKRAKKDEPTTWYLLFLLYPDLVKKYDKLVQDHMHPKSFLEKMFEQNRDLRYDDWQKDIDSLANLQLLTSDDNLSKSNKPLKDWVEGLKKNKKDLFISEETSLEPEDFPKFIEDRRENMKTKLIEIIESLSK